MVFIRNLEKDYQFNDNLDDYKEILDEDED